MKTQRRHELQTNALADRLGALLVWFEANYRTVLGIAVAALLIVGVYVSLNRYSAAKLERGWNAYYQAQTQQNIEAMRQVADENQGTAAGTWARLWVADELLRSGVEQQFQDRSQANDDLRKAAADYEQVISQRVDSLLIQRAKLGLARAYESLDQLEEARKVYRELATGVFADQAEARLADLDRPQTKAFYDWFAAQDPRPSLERGSGRSPFSAPSFDSQLPDEPGTFGSGASAFPSTLDVPAATEVEAEVEGTGPAVPENSQPAPESDEAEQPDEPQSASPTP